MHLQSLKVVNFRALKNIEIDFDNQVNVIVGPNAIGKSTILEAIRLVKAMLSPRTQNESNHALFALGAASPHIPNRLKMNAIAQDEKAAIVISCRYKFSGDEAQWLKSSTPQIATNIVQARMGQAFAFPGALIAFLSSPQGKTELNKAMTEINEEWVKIDAAGQQITIELTITPGVGPASTGNQIGPTLLSALEARNAPSQTIFSYFPADRALPSGEQPVQLGSADSNQQLEAHNSQPQLKYSRLKNTIFSAIVTSDQDRNNLYAEFHRIFSGILKGRHIKGVGINEIGLLSITVEDETGRQFDLDSMSSGEKGLILTFLLIERTLVEGGLILLDEPELHLNPAVCKELLPFIVDQYASRKNLQLIICSHSPEILAGAFDRDECSLYSLTSGSMLTKVRRQDQDVISSALRKLGTSESEELLFKGIIFVEGPDDILVLETGFGDILRRLKLKDLGGRIEVERQIELLQSAEKDTPSAAMRYFIFDRDDVPSSLTSTESVKVLQWDRRCLENYLLDIDAITDLLMDSDVAKVPFTNMGEVTGFLKSLAFNQLTERAAREQYISYGFGDVGLRANEIKGKNASEIAETLLQRLTSMKQQLAVVSEIDWKQEFEMACAGRKEQLREIWEAKWREDCDGKRLFQDIGASGRLRMSIRNFKKRVIAQMRNTQSENWRSVKSLLSELTDAPM
ncbi:AAA family ATPase [Acidithiobacillus ferrooxidans]|uniref:ATP-dependent nuclease n=1 Tax=Acidithiobacillus ferrooxidans TaxID=920 RepID=UPI001C06DDC9|nr:ATP-binding protein [Acidithiobacillus ferrooxidans]MBU2856159.1 AAA family ATPase [Acidithiobacillus ferrooxidans]MBU2861486.1 AAA family ATPase [Acidithiobacillus ferrooxidans]